MTAAGVYMQDTVYTMVTSGYSDETIGLVPGRGAWLGPVKPANLRYLSAMPAGPTCDDVARVETRQGTLSLLLLFSRCRRLILLRRQHISMYSR